MEQEQIFEKFDSIEGKIQKLIEIRKSLEKENSELKDYISELEQELQEKAEAEKKYLEEKNLIRSKVDGVLSRLEDIEEPETEADSDKSYY